MEWLDDLLDIAPPPQLRTIRPRYDPFSDLSEQEFLCRYRLHKNTVHKIVTRIHPILKHDTDRNQALSPEQQTLIALRFFTSATFQTVNSDIFKVHQATVSRCIHKVVDALITIRGDYIKFPDDLTDVKQKFYQYGQFPGVIGCVDGTHIPLMRPRGDAEAEIYRNRKGFFSINVQVVAGPNYKIYDIVARWPGSTHDSRIFSNSLLHANLESNNLHGILLGDSGYPCLRYLMTPLRNPIGPAQLRYNRRQLRTRNIIERTFGIWKKRFPCLAMTLQYEPLIVGKIVVACAVLHNLAIEANEPLDYEPDPVLLEEVIFPDNGPGNACRNTLIQTYFT